jgi:hypothetical protein
MEGSGLDAFLAATLSLERFGTNLAQQWSLLPVLEPTAGRGRWRGLLGRPRTPQRGRFPGGPFRPSPQRTPPAWRTPGTALCTGVTPHHHRSHHRRRLEHPSPVNPGPHATHAGHQSRVAANNNHQESVMTRRLNRYYLVVIGDYNDDDAHGIVRDNLYYWLNVYDITILGFDRVDVRPFNTVQTGYMLARRALQPAVPVRAGGVLRQHSAAA